MEYEFDGTLPEDFKLSKPIENGAYDPAAIYELERQGRLIITRKRDGWKMFLLVGANGKAHFYTDGLTRIEQSKIAHLIAEVEKANIPPRSLLVGEAISDANHDNRGTVIGIMHGKEAARGKLYYDLFNVIFWNGQAVTMSYRDRLTMMKQVCSRGLLEYMHVVSVLDYTFDQAKTLATAEKWEGLVLYDAAFQITFRTDGKSNPKRPYGSWKWKPNTEGDFVALYARMRENDPNTVKDLGFFQIDPSNGRMVRMIHFGGFTAAERARLSALPMIKTRKGTKKQIVIGWFKTPFVARLEYEGRFEKTGKLGSVKEYETRTDKGVDECFAPASYPEAEYLDEEEYNKILKR